MATKKGTTKIAAAPAPATEEKPVWPKDFEFPRMPKEANAAMEDVFMDLIRAYLPPVWVQVIVDWGIMYADMESGAGDFAGFMRDFGDLQEYLAGVRRDEKGKGPITAFVAPARPQPTTDK